MKLVDEWRKSWKWISQWCFITSAALTWAWSNLGTLQASVPPKYAMLIVGAISVTGFIGRLIDQTPPPA